AIAHKLPLAPPLLEKWRSPSPASPGEAGGGRRSARSDAYPWGTGGSPPGAHQRADLPFQGEGEVAARQWHPLPSALCCVHTTHSLLSSAWGLRRSPRNTKARAQAPSPLAQEEAHGCELFYFSARSVDLDRQRAGAADRRCAAPRRA